MAKVSPYSFLVVLPQTIIEIPQSSNLSWLTLFYALPKELVEKRAKYLKLPRNIHQVLQSKEYRKMIEDDSFLELVWDCYAWSAWQFFKIPHKDGTYHEIPGDWSHYSENFPLWRWSYEIIKHFRKKFENEMEWSFQKLFLMDRDDELPWLSYQHFGNLVGNLTDMIVEELNWQPMIDEIWNCRQVNDYTGWNLSKKDFMRSWTHSRTAKHISLDELMEEGEEVDGDELFEIADPRSEFEYEDIHKFYMEDFKSRLTEQDAKILQMRYDGKSLQEIADAVGFKTAGAVSKRIAKIAGTYEDFVSEEYGKFLDEHTT